MTYWQIALGVVIITAIALAIVSVVIWRIEKRPGPRRFRSVKIGSYFQLSDSSKATVCQKVSRTHYSPQSGKQRFDRIEASPNMPVYRVEDLP